MHRHGFRGTHVKTQGIVKGELTINHLRDELAHGICSPENQKVNGGKKPVVLRFANEPSFLQDDREPGPRGCGMKVFDVAGDFLDPMGEKTHTQDMTFNNAPLLELTGLPTTVEIFRIREANFRKPENIKYQLMKRIDVLTQMAPAMLPNHHFVGYTMYSQSAYCWGPNLVAKYALFPTGKLQEELAKKDKIDKNSDPEQHSIWLREFFQQNDATYDLRIQLCENLKDQPVEKCNYEWDERKYPFETVASLLFPKGQDCFDSVRRTFWENKMKLNV
ncbi:catalase-like domain-containing protein [Exophiala viscosa]|uniref:Catalase-like domain-containing protein n=1 Tax=Exophiala viscosa TaxID=2486360 RepID=A0AAN6IGV0_9EURO|nr:catalase-like domain-containing protein [Exophiala viscosa]